MTTPELDQLSFDELRDRAFSVARHRLDLGFFLDVVAHLPAAHAIQAEGGSLGDIAATLSEVFSGFRELTGKDDLQGMEPLFAAKFIDYLRAHGG